MSAALSHSPTVQQSQAEAIILNETPLIPMYIWTLSSGLDDTQVNSQEVNLISLYPHHPCHNDLAAGLNLSLHLYKAVCWMKPFARCNQQQLSNPCQIAEPAGWRPFLKRANTIVVPWLSALNTDLTMSSKFELFLSALGHVKSRVFLLWIIVTNREH